jgi:hypothetical protein
MIDPILSLAHSVHTNKGVYALLVGSGLSRSAGIPTGWEVTLELVQRLAAMMGEDPGAEPDAWYVNRFGMAPGYSALLDELAKSAAERRSILHSFFEPTEDEREQGLKLPTLAHRAIAELVAKGFVKVIVTTNFDRLMETALQDAGVVPVVISTADATRGAAPLVHQRCVVVKVHGDYLDDRIMNTEAELSAYDPAMDAYLDRVFDEFGLIVCGWSGEWDPALRAAIERCPSRRYTSFWTGMGSPGPFAAKLIALRSAQCVSITGADSFFGGLSEKISGLEAMAGVGPLGVGAAVAAIKRYVAEPRYRVRLDDLITEEIDRTLRRRDERALPSARGGAASFGDLARACDASTEVLRHMIFHAARWGEAHHFEAIRRAIASLVPSEPRSGEWPWITAYPGSTAFYAACAGAEAGGNYLVLDRLFRMRYRFHGRDYEAIPELCAALVIDGGDARLLHERPGSTPMSDHLAGSIVPMLEGVAVDPDFAFSRLEVLMALAHIDRQDDPAGTPWLMQGRFARRHQNSVYGAVIEEAERMGSEWAPLKAGLFRGGVARLSLVRETFMALLRREAGRYR